MPIAIYRHLKLSVALPIAVEQQVLNFTNRRIRHLSIDQDLYGEWFTTLMFRAWQRRLSLVLTQNTFWQFRQGAFTVITQHLRNDSLVSQTQQHVAPASTEIWTECGRRKAIMKQFTEGTTARVVIEQYLHRWVVNPDDFKIVVVDFDPANALLERPLYAAHNVRSKEAVELAKRMDQTKDAEQWAQLFLD